jgi:hypothetical protein
MNRNVSVLIALAIVLVVVVIGVLALSQAPSHNPTGANPYASKPTTSEAAGDPLVSSGACSDLTTVFRFAGYEKTVATSNGVTATIDPDAGFKRCSGPGVTDPTGHGASWAWVALFDPINQNAILQIGIVDCNDDISASACAGYNPGTHHYVWAYGGCGGATPDGRDLGLADNGAHLFKIQLSSGTYNLYRDGVLQTSISQSSAAISCWDTRSDREVGWYGERHDYNDGLGTSVFPNTRFTGMQYLTGTSWTNVGNPGCTRHDSGSLCSFNNSNDMSIWTAL